MNSSNTQSNTNKIGFYPCCGNDILNPLKIMKGMVDEVIFCEKYASHTLRKLGRERILKKAIEGGLPIPTFRIEDVRSAIPNLPKIHIYFYRGDSFEGGSNLYLLNQKWLAKVLEHFPKKGGLIITDGSNHDRHFRKIIRPSGYHWSAIGYQFKPVNPTDEVLGRVRKGGGPHLYFIQVERVNGTQNENSQGFLV